MDSESENKKILEPGTELQRLVQLVPKDKKKEATELVGIVQARIMSYEGPIPPPEQFGQYENILPGSADRILTMAENEQKHRIEIENKAIHSNTSFNRRGQLLGFFALILMLGLAVFFAFQGMQVWAGTVGTVTVVTIVGLFITGKVSFGRGDSQEK